MTIPEKPDTHKEFQVHMLNSNGKSKATSIANVFNYCLTALESYCPSGREMSIVRTKLEEASFFAKKAMANDPSNTE